MLNRGYPPAELDPIPGETEHIALAEPRRERKRHRVTLMLGQFTLAAVRPAPG